MPKILNLIKSAIFKILQWLWKTFYALVFSLYYMIRKFSLQNRLDRRYLVIPSATILLTFLILLESFLTISDANLSHQIFLLKLDKQPEKVTVETNNDTKQKAQTDKLTPDFKIATTDEQNSSAAPINFDDAGTAMGGAALIGPDVILDETPVMRTDIETYIVQPGDTIESVAQKFAISVKSILWENKLNNRSILRTGQELKILPIDGITHTVKSGETLDKIAKTYKASVEDIVDFNNLADATDIYVGDFLIIPEGQLPPPPPPRKPTPSRTPDKTLLVEGQKYGTPEGNNCHRFVPGQCTWYVATKRCIPWTGHAKYWIANARRAGFTIGKTPAVGAAIALRESWYGHVAYVEDFDDQTVTFTEMNHAGPWIVTKRTLKLNDYRIVGYIY